MSSPSPLQGQLRPSGKLLQEDARKHHRTVLLQHLFREGPASRADLARASGLTRVTVSDLIAELLSDGLVTELGAPAESRVGKPPVLVGIDVDSFHIVSIDLSADRVVRGAVLNLRGDVLGRREVDLGERRGNHAADLVLDLARGLIDLADRLVLGIGVASPGVIDPAGVVIDAPNLGWHSLDLAGLLSESTGKPTYVANDANVAALGEHTFGGGSTGGLMVLRIGTGVGAGLIVGGQLLTGNLFAAGEVGHVVTDPDGDLCACGRTGCLETVVSAPALRRRTDGVDDGDAVLAATGERLGAALAPIVAALNLHELILSGPADLLDGALREATAHTIRRNTMPVIGDELVVRTSALDEDVVLAGAAVLVLAAELGVS